MIETPTAVQVPEQAMAMLHLTIPREEIRNVMWPGLQEVLAAVTAQGMSPAGPWGDHHLKMSPDIFDFEICVPVSTPIKAAGRVKPGTRPAMKAARTVFHGNYEDLSEAWEKFDAWVEAQGLQPAEDLWQTWSVGPETSENPDDWRTELLRPLKS